MTAMADWDAWAAEVAREDSVVSRVSRGSSRGRAESPLRDISSPVGRLRRVKLPLSRERSLSPTREELVLLSKPQRQVHRRRRRTPPAGRLQPLYDPNEPPELAELRREQAATRATSPGLYGEASEQEIVRPPRVPSARQAERGRRRRGRRRDRSQETRSRSPDTVTSADPVAAFRALRAKQTVELPQREDRGAYFDQLTSIEHVRDSLPISFLIETGQHKEVLRRRLSYAMSIYRRERLKNYKYVLDKWWAVCKYLRSTEFVERIGLKARQDACERWEKVFEMSCDLALQRRIRLWCRNMRLLRAAERRRIRNAAARILQKFVRQVLARWAGYRLLFRLKRKRAHADACADLTIAHFQRQQFRAARLMRSRALADTAFTNACTIQHLFRLCLSRRQLARRIREAQLAREAAAALQIGKFMNFLNADASRSNRMGGSLLRWREKKLLASKGLLTEEEYQSREQKMAEMRRMIAERKKRAEELRRAKGRKTADLDGDGVIDVDELEQDARAKIEAAKQAAADRAAGRVISADASSAAVLAGGDLAEAAEQAEMEEIRRLEAELAHEEEMARLRALQVPPKPQTPEPPPPPPPDPEKCAVMMQKRVRSWNMRLVLQLKRKAREAYLMLFYDMCDHLQEMIGVAVIIRTYRKVLQWRDWRAAEGASADAVALLATNYLFMLLSDEHKAKTVVRDAAARYEQRIWRDRRRRRRDWHYRIAKKLQVQVYMWLARKRVQDKREARAEFVRRTKAADVLFHWYHRTLQRRALLLRFSAADDLSASAAQHAALHAVVAMLRRMFDARRCRAYIRRRVHGRRRLREVEARRVTRDRAVALISKNYRRHWDRRHAYLRKVAHMQRRRVRKRHSKRQACSKLLAKHWFAMQWRYNQPLRIIARRRIETHEQRCREVVEQVKKDDAALVFRRAIRRWLDWKYLCRRFAAQRERIDLEEALRRRLRGAEAIQQNWLAYLERCAERARVLALRDRDARREELELQEDAAFQIQRCAHCYLFNQLLELRFQAAKQRLDAEKEQRRRVDAARHERRDAEKAQELAEAALKQVELSSWKMGADEEGTNYYYNWVNGESSYDKPEGWYPPAEEVWIKQTDARGNVFYFNQDTLESAWFPPCMICMRLEAKKVCFSCEDSGPDGIFYCSECFESNHDEEEVQNHKWRGADQDKEELKPGEKHCLVCGKAKAKLVCKVCRDAYCDKCFEETHSHGQLKAHPTIPFHEARLGWQKIVGRVAGEQTYYYNVSTGENRFDKPEEFMLEDELREHNNFLKFQFAAETHSKKVGELQVEVERLQYEKDTTMYNLSKAKTKDSEELDELRRLLMEDQSKLGFMGKYGAMLGNPYGYWKENRDRRIQKRKMYRKMLLLNKREREAAFHDKDTVFAASGAKTEQNAAGLTVVKDLEYKN